jgi:site-specific DNA recombinase
MLLSFAQYERELIAERTRHKVHAARRKGKFTGGTLPLGYDRDPKGGRLVVNKVEAERVREIFRVFLKNPSVPELAADLNRRGWTLKQWETKKGRTYGGGRFTKFNLQRLLQNPVYIGKVLLKGSLHDGEHEAIIDEVTWQRVQEALSNGRRGPQRRSSRSPNMLAGLLYCRPSGYAMTPVFTQKGPTRYRYYLCGKAHRDGWASCPTKSVPAREIESFVVDQIRAIGRDPELIARTTQEANRQLAARKAELSAEAKNLRKELDRAHQALRNALRPITGSGNCQPRPRRLRAKEEAIQALEDRLAAVEGELATLRAQRIDPDDLRSVLEAFDPVWEQLTPTEQAKVVQLLIERVDYDGETGRLAITLRPTGVRTLAAQPGQSMEAGA